MTCQPMARIGRSVLESNQPASGVLESNQPARLTTLASGGRDHAPADYGHAPKRTAELAELVAARRTTPGEVTR
jgi:hypothetical protein